MSDDCQSQNHIAELEQSVQQLRERVARLEAVQPHMASKADMIEARGDVRADGRKRKYSHNPYWINNNKNFAIALAAVVVFTLFFTPTVITLVQALYACLL